MRGFNFNAAVLIAVIHFAIGVMAVAMVGLGHNYWYWIAYIFTFPLKTFGSMPLGQVANHFTANHAVGEVVVLAAMAIQSGCWGILLSLIFCPKKR